MQSRNNPYATADLTDFSSVFMHTSSAEQLSALQMLDEDPVRPATNEAIQEHDIYQNRNVSSIISHIRDEGSARLEPKKTVRRKRQVMQKAPKAPARKTSPVQTPIPQPVPVKKEEIEMAGYQNGEENTQETRRGQWLPLVLSLAIAVTAMMGYNLYQLNEQTNEMKVALLSYEEQIDELSDTQSKSTKTITKVSNINVDITELKHELSAIKADYANIDNKLAQSTITSGEPQNEAIATMKQNVSELENSLASTRSEVTEIKAAIDRVKDTVAVKEEQPVKTKAAKQGGWVVNLASLSSKVQAQIGLAKLEKQSGIIPGIQEVEVNGATIYRLFVKGFSSRDEAMLFISTAKTQYGFVDGWVWRA